MTSGPHGAFASTDSKTQRVGTHIRPVGSEKAVAEGSCGHGRSDLVGQICRDAERRCLAMLPS